MTKFKVIFRFDADNSVTFFIGSENKESLIYNTIGHKEWFYHEDDKGVFHSINMKLVTSISAEEM